MRQEVFDNTGKNCRRISMLTVTPISAGIVVRAQQYYVSPFWEDEPIVEAIVAGLNSGDHFEDIYSVFRLIIQEIVLKLWV